MPYPPTFNLIGVNLYAKCYLRPHSADIEHHPEESLVNKSDLSETGANVPETEPDGIEVSKPAKKSFVIPEISVPVDVLEATTFFQLADSGATN